MFLSYCLPNNPVIRINGQCCVRDVGLDWWEICTHTSDASSETSIIITHHLQTCLH